MGLKIARIKASTKRKKEMARENILHYFEQAKVQYHNDSSLSNRYMVMAKKMALRFRVAIPSQLRWRRCKTCGHYLVPAKNARVRVDKGMRVILCKDCNSFSRFRYKK